MPTVDISGLEFVVDEVVISHSGPMSCLKYVSLLEEMQDSLSKHISEVKEQSEWFTLAVNPSIRKWRASAHSFNMKAKTMAFHIKSISMEVNS